MALLDFETALGRLIRAPNGTDPLRALHLDAGEAVCLDALQASAGYKFTVGVQRSWCVGRAERAGRLTLSILAEGLRRRLLDEWTEAGGGTSSFFVAEAEALLDFIASRLPDPSHELTACRFEQATLRANEGSIGFTPPDPARIERPGCLVRRGHSAGMAVFYGEPDSIIQALIKQQPLPPVADARTAVLFGPGFERLWRVASPGEACLWNRLTVPVAVADLISEGHKRDDICALVQAGVLDAEIA